MISSVLSLIGPRFVSSARKVMARNRSRNTEKEKMIRSMPRKLTAVSICLHSAINIDRMNTSTRATWSAIYCQ